VAKSKVIVVEYDHDEIKQAKSSILGLQPRGKAAMLVVNTIQFCFAEFA